MKFRLRLPGWTEMGRMLVKTGMPHILGKMEVMNVPAAKW
jgi:hypothetical protein